MLWRAVRALSAAGRRGLSSEGLRCENLSHNTRLLLGPATFVRVNRLLGALLRTAPAVADQPMVLVSLFWISRTPSYPEDIIPSYHLGLSSLVRASSRTGSPSVRTCAGGRVGVSAGSGGRGSQTRQ